jgi:hypothetical protein
LRSKSTRRRLAEVADEEDAVHAALCDARQHALEPPPTGVDVADDRERRHGGED